MRFRWLMLCAMLLTACQTAQPAPSPVSQTSPTTTPNPAISAQTASRTAIPTLAQTATPWIDAATATPLTADLQQQATDLQTFVATSMNLPLSPPTVSANSDIELKLMGVKALPLTTNQQALWAVYTLGYASDTPHSVMLYRQNNGTWQEVARYELGDMAFALWEDGVHQLRASDNNVWLAVNTGFGNHGSTYDLLRWDGERFTTAIHHESGIALPAHEIDIDGDGTPEIVRDQRDTYTFCHACGLDILDYKIWQKPLGESDFRLITLSMVTGESDADKRSNQAVWLAQGGLWADAQRLIAQAQTADSNNKTVRLNKFIIDLYAQGYREQRDSTQYKLLGQILYGDYAGALATFKAFTPAELFDQAQFPQNLQDVLAMEANDSSFSAQNQRIIEATTRTIGAQPENPIPYFLRGWTLSFGNLADQRALHDLERAAELDPNEPLFRDSLTYLREKLK